MLRVSHQRLKPHSKRCTVVASLGGDSARRVSLSLILIHNDPREPCICQAGASGAESQKPETNLSDLLSPLRALLATRVARSRLAEGNAVNLMRRLNNGTVQSPRCSRGCVFEFGLTAGDVEPPLGWSLSVRAQNEMKTQLEDQRDRFACIESLLTGGQCVQAPVCESADVTD